MLTVLQIYYLAAGGLLFLFALNSPRRALTAFVAAMAVNIFPLALLPYMSMDIARIGGMPLVYVPVTAVGLAMVLRNGWHLPRTYTALYVWMTLYLVYTFCNTVLVRGLTPDNLVYWLAWPLNFLIFIAAAATVARLDAQIIGRALYGCVLLLVAASALGIVRYLVGIQTDSNFIPLMNRNGTVVLIALLFPLVFHIYETRRKSRTWLLFCAGTIAVCVLLTFSRSGLVGLIAGTLLYYGRFSLMGVLKATAAVAVVTLLLNTGIAEQSKERLWNTTRSVSAIMEGRDVDRSVGDHNRVMLLHGAVANAKAHFWFGTGLGMDNYREGMRKASHLPITSKAHNFYLSYFTELGIVGFTLLLFLLQRIFAGLAPLGSQLRAFRVSYLVIAVMMMMNEYILLPELWVFFGILTGITTKVFARQINAEPSPPTHASVATPQPVPMYTVSAWGRHMSNATRAGMRGNHG